MIVNGAAAHLIHKGDTLIILSYVTVSEDEARRHEPKLVYVHEPQLDDDDKTNSITRIGHEVSLSATVKTAVPA